MRLHDLARAGHLVDHPIQLLEYNNDRAAQACLMLKILLRDRC